MRLLTSGMVSVLREVPSQDGSAGVSRYGWGRCCCTSRPEAGGFPRQQPRPTVAMAQETGRAVIPHMGYASRIICWRHVRRRRARSSGITARGVLVDAGDFRPSSLPRRGPDRTCRTKADVVTRCAHQCSGGRSPHRRRGLAPARPASTASRLRRRMRRPGRLCPWVWSSATD